MTTSRTALRALLPCVLTLLMTAACGDAQGDDPAPGSPESEVGATAPANGTLHFVWLPELQGFGEGIPCASGVVPALPAAARVAADLEAQGDLAILACVGNALIQPGSISGAPAAVAASSARSDIDLDAMAAAGVDVYVPGHGDMIHGLENLLDRAAERGIPVVISNVEVDGRDDLKPYLIVEHAGMRFAILAVVPKQGTRVEQDDLVRQEGVTFTNPGRRIRELSREILESGEANAIVCLSSLTSEANQGLCKIPNLHFLIGAADVGIDQSEVVSLTGTTMFLQPTSGRAVGLTTFCVVDDDWNLSDISARHVLPETLAKEREVLQGFIETFGTDDIQELAPLVIPYNPENFILKCELMEENTAWLKETENWTGSFLDHQSADLEPLPGDDPIMAILAGHGAAIRHAVGELNTAIEPLPSTRTIPQPEDCRSCHEAQVDFWARTPHASAYQILVEQGRENDSSCLACHTTGFGLLGGYRDPRHEAPFGSVTCLHCHEVQDPHVINKRLVVDPLYVTADRDTMKCGTCHNPDRDPDFDRASALDAVTCPPMRVDDPVLLEARANALDAIHRARERGTATEWEDFLEGRALVGMGRPQEGLPLVREYIRGRTDWPQMTYFTARYLEENGDARGSLELFKEYLALVPGDLEMNIAYIQLLATSDDPSVLDKEHALSHAQLIAPPDAKDLTAILMPAYLAQVDILMETNRTPEAQAFLGRLKERFADNDELEDALRKYGLKRL